MGFPYRQALTIHGFVRRPDCVRLSEVPGVRPREHMSCQGQFSLCFEHLHANTVCVCARLLTCVLNSLLESMIRMFWFMFVFTSMTQTHSLHHHKNTFLHVN